MKTFAIAFVLEAGGKVESFLAVLDGGSVNEVVGAAVIRAWKDDPQARITELVVCEVNKGGGLHTPIVCTEHLG